MKDREFRDQWKSFDKRLDSLFAASQHDRDEIKAQIEKLDEKNSAEHTALGKKLDEHLERIHHAEVNLELRPTFDQAKKIINDRNASTLKILTFLSSIIAAICAIIASLLFRKGDG